MSYNISDIGATETSATAATMTAGALVDDEAISWFVLNLDYHSVIYYVASTAMIFGGVIPYYPQYREIERTENASGFSTYVCLALIAANSLRIVFWFGKHFEIPLLIQSVVMMIAMFLMIEICVRMRRRNASVPQKRTLFNDKKKEDDTSDENSDEELELPAQITLTKYPPDIKFKHFWQWTDLLSYLECTAAFIVVTGVLMYIFMESIIFVEAVGYLSLSIEALLGAPQLVKNFNNKSTAGMSVLMILLWAGGDLFKTVYFVLNQVPKQFIICGAVQVTIDILILVQVSIYSTTNVIIDLKKAESPTMSQRSLRS